MPIGVIGNNFAKEMNRYIFEQKKRDIAAKQERKRRTFLSAAKKAGTPRGAATTRSEPHTSGDKTKLDSLTAEQIESLNSVMRSAMREASPQKLLALAHDTQDGSWGSVGWPKGERQAWQRDFRRLSRHQGASTQAASVEELQRVGRGLSRWLIGTFLAERPEPLVGPELAAGSARQVELLSAVGAAAKWLEAQLDEIAPAGAGRTKAPRTRPATARGHGGAERERLVQQRPATAPARSVALGEPQSSTGSARID
jgi:hypothetical protein